MCGPFYMGGRSRVVEVQIDGGQNGKYNMLTSTVQEENIRRIGVMQDIVFDSDGL